ncbi:MAG: hypothetical protein WC496_05435 [Phycisphaerae bacterium]|jgi:hypothetical protein
MRFRCVQFWGVLACICCALCISCAIADPNNGSFELFDYNEVFDFNTPTGWYHENYAAVIGQFTPDENLSEWHINSLLPFDGNNFLMLSTGDFNPEPIYAKVWQNINIEAGNKLTGVYFFGTYDWLPEWNDFADIKLIPVIDANLQELTVAHMEISYTGSYRSMAGWRRFEYTFEPNQAGNYNLVITVNDVGDYRYNTYFAVDGLVLCQNPSGPGDLNCDCTVNFEDFTILARDWQCDCNDTAIYNDPNGSCLLGTDITGDGPVDMNDLQIMSENWLTGSLIFHHNPSVNGIKP